MIALRWIGRADPAYMGERDLRYRVLRAPLGMPRGSEENAAEASCEHLVALEGERVVGCLIARRDRDGRAQLMQMAVEPTHQERGIGRRLVRKLERDLASGDVTEIYLHAREVALGFYLRLGYATSGATFTEVGLPHRLMARSLESAPEASGAR